MELHGSFEPGALLRRFQDTGSFDPDFLDLRLTEMLERAGAARRKGAAFLLTGGLLTLTLAGAPLGLLLIRVGWHLWQAGSRHARSVRQAFEAYTRHPPHVHPPSRGESR